MLGRLLALVIVLVVGYYALTEGLPWIQAALDSSSGSAAPGDDSGFCVARASAASGSLADELIPHARPPVDQAVWGGVLVRVAGDLAEAERACACPTAACTAGAEAVRELRALFDELDDIARGNPMGIGNPARRQERVDQLLDEARALARSE